MLEEIVGEGDAAGDGEVADHHAGETQRGKGRRAAAIECGQFAHHAQVLRGDEQDIECGGGRHGGQQRDAPRRMGDDAVRLAVAPVDEVALGKADAVAPVEYVSLVALHLAQAQLRIGTAGIKRLQLFDGALGGGAVVGVDGVGSVELDVLDAAQAGQRPDLTQDDGQCGEGGDAGDGQRRPAEDGRAREEILDQLGDGEARPHGDEGEEGGEQQCAPAEACGPRHGGRHDDQGAFVRFRLESDAGDGPGLPLRLVVPLGLIQHEGLRVAWLAH